MFNKYFGNYILTKKILSNDQLKRVLSEQKTARVKLGVLAIESGYMTAFQVNRTHKLQVLQDRKFGEIAVSEGFIKEEQLMELLSKQKTSQIMLGQILVDDGLLTYERYEELLKEYKKDSGLTDQEIEVLKGNNTDDIVKIFVNRGKNDLAPLFSEYAELFIRNMVRFIDSEVIIEKPYFKEAYQFKNFAGQKIIGEIQVDTGISAEDDVLVKFASTYADEQLSEIDEMVKDALGEFMNNQNGLFVSNLYHKNVNCDLVPPKFECSGSLRPKERLFVLPCELSFGKIDIIFNM
jgi:CheY-specific phosphatase CheX